jgi:hypothetical protein
MEKKWSKSLGDLKTGKNDFKKVSIIRMKDLGHGKVLSFYRIITTQPGTEI